MSKSTKSKDVLFVFIFEKHFKKNLNFFICIKLIFF
jgi:hypothetical protein